MPFRSSLAEMVESYIQALAVNGFEERLARWIGSKQNQAAFCRGNDIMLVTQPADEKSSLIFLLFTMSPGVHP